MKLLFKLLLIVVFSFSTNASSFSLLTSLTSSSDLAGGLRYIPSNEEVIDFGVTYDSTNDNTEPGFWVDYYYRHFGVLLSAPASEAASFSLMFATEGSISDSVGIGIGFKILSVTKVDSPTYLSGWDAYLIIPI